MIGIAGNIDYMVKMLHQALWGAITPDLRMVTVTLDYAKPHVRFVYESYNSEHREDVIDIMSAFEAFMGKRVEHTYSIEERNDLLAWPEHPEYVILRRREETASEP